MAAKYYTILTQTGKAKVANAAALGRQIKLTHLAVGDGNGSEYDPTEDQISLRGENYRTPISNLGTDEQNPNWVIAEGMIPVDVGSWFVREVGLFDEDGDLFAIGKYPETYKPTLAEGTGRDLYIRFIMVVSNTDTIDMKVDPTVAIATKQWTEGNFQPLNEKHIRSVLGISFDTSVDNRDILYTNSDTIFIPKGVTIRCNFHPEDDVRKFKGEGLILTRDQWGNEHTFDVGLSNNGSIFTPSNVISQGCRMYNKTVSVGILGDSITDGADSDGWTANPIDASGNLSSTNYNHNFNGGENSWFNTFARNVNDIAGNDSVVGYNASSSGKRLFDGWSYRNFDYGFFQNAAYGNTAPDVLYIAMGVNDNGQILDFTDFEDYLDQFDAIIRKAWGYGCAVGFISITNLQKNWAYLDSSIKRKIGSSYRNVDYHDLAAYLDRYRLSGYVTAKELWQDAGVPYDFTHPNDVGHKFLGACMAKEVIGHNIFDARPGVNFIPQTNADAKCVTFPSKTVLSPTLVDISGGYLDEFQAWAKYTPNSENITITYYVWNESIDTSMIVFEPDSGEFTGQSFGHVIKVFANDDRNLYQTCHLGSRGVSDFNEYKTAKVSRLAFGLNIIEVIYDGAPTSIFMPALLFRKNSNYAAIGLTERNLPGNTVELITFIGEAPKILNGDYQPVSCISEFPDEHLTKDYDYLGHVEIKCSNGGGLMLFSKYKCQRGIRVVKKSDSVVELKTYSGTSLRTVSGDFTGSWSVKWNVAPSESQVFVIDSTGSSTLVSIERITGGNVMVVNEHEFSNNIKIFGGLIGLD